MGSQFLTLSLFIMLLSFFIVMNAMSTREGDKSRSVLQSLDLAFSSNALEGDISASYRPDPLKSTQEGDTLDRLKALFQSQISGFEATKNRLGTTMRVRIPLEALEQALRPSESAGGAEDIGGFFLPTLVSLMQSDEAGIPYRMDMVLNVPENPALMSHESAAEIAQHVRKMAFFAQVMEDQGLPKKLVSPGLAQGPKGTVDLFFRRYAAFNPVGTQEQE